MESGAGLLIQLILMLIFGGITASVAYSKGRNAVGWFFVGFLAGCIGLIVALCMSDLKEEAAKWERNREEQRRLREQLRQERLKSAGFQQHVHQRLDVHDKALNMDTRQLEGAPPPAMLSEGTPPSTDELPAWYYVLDNERIGPVTLGNLRNLLAEGRITKNTLIWNGSFDNWKAISQLPGLFEGLS